MPNPMLKTQNLNIIFITFYQFFDECQTWNCFLYDSLTIYMIMLFSPSNAMMYNKFYSILTAMSENS